ncbi:MAG TPA: trypsin-like peptidase domain-containing protein, partial [Candidatus Kapabacteria bacterium]|nr:trypsin-like peptidase domain-containing protein [Candidatus Kapabacteria bacterium]
VKDKMMATLSRSEIYCNKSIHVLGHPVGLPLKYASGETVSDNSDKSYFTANLNIYSGNSGSPVFNSDKHEVIGLVVRGYDQYFSLEKDCWVSIDHANLFSHGGVHCTKVSEFIDFIGKL